MNRTDMEKRERIYDEMERGGLSAAFRNPPYYLMPAARMKRKEKEDGVRKETDGKARAADMGAG